MIFDYLSIVLKKIHKINSVRIIIIIIIADTFINNVTCRIFVSNCDVF